MKGVSKRFETLQFPSRFLAEFAELMERKDIRHRKQMNTKVLRYSVLMSVGTKFSDSKTLKIHQV